MRLLEGTAWPRATAGYTCERSVCSRRVLCPRAGVILQADRRYQCTSTEHADVADGLDLPLNDGRTGMQTGIAHSRRPPGRRRRPRHTNQRRTHQWMRAESSAACLKISL